MVSRCTICGRADRSVIEANLASGAGSLQTIAARYGLSKTALIRHRDRHIAEALNPVSNPAAQNKAPVTVRHLTRPAIVAEPVAEPCEAAAHDDTEIIPGPCEPIEPDVARLRAVANMLARGLSRAEIAQHYDVHPDTVTVWHRMIRERGILRVKSTTAAEIVATLLHNQAQRSAVLWNVVHDAQAKGLARITVAALDGLRKEDRHVFDIAQGIGAFDQFRLAQEPGTSDGPPGLPDAMQEGLAYLSKACASLYDSDQGFTWEHGSNPDPDELQASETPAETDPQDIEPIF